MNVVDEAIRNWEAERANVIAELENIPEQHWDFTPAPGARSVRELGMHIVAAGLFLSGEMLRPDGSYLRFFEPHGDAAPPSGTSRAEILEALRVTGREIAERLRAAGGQLAYETMPTFHGPESRLTALWFAVGHEMYHCGQLAAYARQVGVVPALTQRITALSAATE